MKCLQTAFVSFPVKWRFHFGLDHGFWSPWMRCPILWAHSATHICFHICHFPSLCILSFFWTQYLQEPATCHPMSPGFFTTRHLSPLSFHQWYTYNMSRHGNIVTFRSLNAPVHGEELMLLRTAVTQCHQILPPPTTQETFVTTIFSTYDFINKFSQFIKTIL